jgi:hypothetical protein
VLENAMQLKKIMANIDKMPQVKAIVLWSEKKMPEMALA